MKIYTDYYLEHCDEPLHVNCFSVDRKYILSYIEKIEKDGMHVYMVDTTFGDCIIYYCGGYYKKIPRIYRS